MTGNIMVKKLGIKGMTFRLTLEVPGEIVLSEAMFVYRNVVSPKEYPLHLEQKNNETTVSGDVSHMEFTYGDWDVYVKAKDGSRFPVILNGKTRLRLILGNYEIRSQKGFLLFPMGSTGHMLTFRFRELSEYDGPVTSAKTVLAFVLYQVLKPLWKKKRIWLIYEKFCKEAQDNGFYFFKYCMENLPEKERKHIFFIMDKKSPQWEKTQKYKEQILPFMSLKHMLYLMAARVYAASDARSHSFLWLPKPNLITRTCSRKPILFLQHGVTAFKKVDCFFGKNGFNPMTHFAVTSKFEQDIVMENFGYTKENVPILGFCRWDVLENKASEKNRTILIMPTWRSWLEAQTEEMVAGSQYCSRYRSLMENRELGEFLKEQKVKLVFHIHPKMQEYLKAFEECSEYVEFVSQGSRQLNELMMECSMLITDYSSVSWDVYYMGKPVLFYQFDYDLYEKAHGSYLNMETELFGERCMEEEALVEQIKTYVRRDFVEKEKYAAMRKERFAYTDKNNCKRTLEYLKSRGY